MEELINRHNSRQTTLAVLAVVISLGGTCGAYVFFNFLARQIAFLVFDYKGGFLPFVITMLILAMIYWEGFRRFKAGLHQYGFEESPFFLDLDWSNGGAMFVEMEMTRITGPAYVLTQIFLGGPLHLMKARAFLANRIEPHVGLAQDLQQLLDTVRTTPKWHSIEKYREDYTGLRQLISMNLVEFSARKGLVKPAVLTNESP